MRTKTKKCKLCCTLILSSRTYCSVCFQNKLTKIGAKEKICNCCLLTKSVSHFHKDKNRRDGLAHTCKVCMAKYHAKHYHSPENKIKKCEYVIRYRRALQKNVQDIKYQYGCAFCDEKLDVCLEFHHINKNKTNNVSTLVLHKSRRKVIEEINKCIVVCRNCHAKIHAGLLSTIDKPACNTKLQNCKIVRVM